MFHSPPEQLSDLNRALRAICALGLHKSLSKGWRKGIAAYISKAQQLAAHDIEIKSAVENTEHELTERLWQLHTKLEEDCRARVSMNSEDYFFSGAIVSGLPMRRSPQDSTHSSTNDNAVRRHPLNCSSRTCTSNPAHFQLNHTSDPRRQVLPHRLLMSLVADITYRPRLSVRWKRPPAIPKPWYLSLLNTGSKLASRI